MLARAAGKWATEESLLRRHSGCGTTGYPLRSAEPKRSTIAAAGSTSVIAPTLWPAYIAIASTSPSMPASQVSRVPRDAARDLLTLAWALTGQRATSGFPALVGAVAQHTMRRCRPPHVEQLSQRSVAGLRLHQSGLVPRVGVGLIAGQESGAHNDGLNAGSERGTRRRRIPDPARSKQWQRDRPSRLGQQRQEPYDALYMAASLDALDNQRVSARIGCRSRCVRRSDLHQHSRARGPRTRDQLWTESEGERHDRRALFNGHLEPLVLLKIEHKIHAERSIRHPPDRSDPLAQHIQLSPGCAKRAEPSGP